MEDRFKYLCDLSWMFFGKERIAKTEFVESCFLENIRITDAFPTDENGVQLYTVTLEKTIFSPQNKLLGKIIQNNEVIADVVGICKNSFIHLLQEKEGKYLDLELPITLVAYNKTEFCFGWKTEKKSVFNQEYMNILNIQIQENIKNFWSNPYINSDLDYEETPVYVELVNQIKTRKQSENQTLVNHFLIKKNHDLLDDIQIKHFNNLYNNREFFKSILDKNDIASQFLKVILSYSKITYAIEKNNYVNNAKFDIFIDISVSELIDLNYLVLVGIVLNPNAIFIFGQRISKNKYIIKVYSKDMAQAEKDIRIILKNDMFQDMKIETYNFDSEVFKFSFAISFEIDHSSTMHFDQEIISKIENIFKNHFDKKRQRKWKGLSR